jgi:hypothetical protein
MTTDPLAPPARGEPAPTPRTMWVMHCPFRKNGSPVVGTMGSTVRTVVIFDIDEWKRLCEEVPHLATTHFRVGSYE